MFLDPAQLPLVASLESNWRAIRDEMLALPEDSFDPWVQRQMHGKDWRVYGLFVMGCRIEAACQACPRTANIIQSMDGVSLSGFSRMDAHSHISRLVATTTASSTVSVSRLRAESSATTSQIQGTNARPISAQRQSNLRSGFDRAAYCSVLIYAATSRIAASSASMLAIGAICLP